MSKDVHHLDSVSYLIKLYELTSDSCLTCNELFNIQNAIVLTALDWKNYLETELIVAK